MSTCYIYVEGMLIARAQILTLLSERALTPSWWTFFIIVYFWFVFNAYFFFFFKLAYASWYEQI